MVAKLLILCLLAFGVIFLLRLRQKLAMLAVQIRGLREHVLAHVTYRPAGSVVLEDKLLDVAKEADKLGFVMLGDYIEEAKHADQERALRWFVDGDGTTFGWMAPFYLEGRSESGPLHSGSEGQKHTILVLMSHELDAQTITTRQPLASTLSRPPFVALHALPPATSFENVLAKHRAKAGLDDPERAFIPVRTFEQVTAELGRMREKIVAWRSAQPADQLLDADLKSLLGPQYDKLAGPLKRRLA